MNFIFECSTRYLTSERSELVGYRVDILYIRACMWSRMDLFEHTDHIRPHAQSTSRNAEKKRKFFIDEESLTILIKSLLNTERFPKKIVL